MQKTTSPSNDIIVQWSPCVAGRYALSSADRLTLYDYGERANAVDSEAVMVASRDISEISCMDWSPHMTSKDVMVYGTSSGSVTLMNWGTGEDELVNVPLKHGTRPCTSVAWNHTTSSLVAASFDKVRSEYCAMVWDMERGGALDDKASHGGMSPVFRASYQEGASCVTWVPKERSLLLVGTVFGYMRIFDMNGSRKNDVGSVMAYKKDTPGDPIKIWDLRKMDTPSFRIDQTVAVVCTDDENSMGLSPSRMVTEVQWSPARRGVLAVASNGSSNVNFFDVLRGDDRSGNARDSGEDAPVGEVTVVASALFNADCGCPVRDVSWSRGQHLQQINTDATRRDPRPRLLLATAERAFHVPVVEAIPLAVGRDDVVFSGRAVEVHPLHAMAVITDESRVPLSPVGSTGHRVGECGMADDPVMDPSLAASDAFKRHSLDMDVLMRRRAQAGYGIDGTRNAQVLSHELDDMPHMSGGHYAPGLTAQTAQTTALQHVWDWLNRVESLVAAKPDFVGCIANEAAVTSLRANAEASAQPSSMEDTSSAGFSLTTCGVLKVVGMRASIARSMPSLCTSTYESKRRNLARALCGWCETVEIGNDTRSGASGDYGGHGSDSNSSDSDDDSSSDSSDDSIKSTYSGNSSTSSTSSSSSSSKEDSASGSGSSDGDAQGLPEKGDRHTVKMLLRADGTGDADRKAESIPRDNAAWRSPTDHGPLVEIIEEIEIIDSFERAAALALFHGNPGLAVRVLQRSVHERRKAATTGPCSPRHHTHQHYHFHQGGSTGVIDGIGVGSVSRKGSLWSFQNLTLNTELSGAGGAEVGASGAGVITDGDPMAVWDEQMGEDYLQVVSLVAMAIAGFMNIAKGSSSHSRKGKRRKAAVSQADEMWKSMSLEVLRQIRAFHRPAASYLTAMMHFLLCNLRVSLSTTEHGHTKSKTSGMSKEHAYHTLILDDQQIALEDRVGFACTFLSDGEVTHFLKGLEKKCLKMGNIEGLLLTGLSEDGIELLRHYIDRYDDIQTTALLAARLEAVHVTPAAGETPHCVWVWLYEYRRLLNRWQFFVQRALLDVALGSMYRSSRSGKTAEDKHKGGRPPDGREGSVPGGPSTVGKGPFASRHGNSGGSTGARRAADGSDRRSAADRTLWTLPPQSPGAHVFLRCHYCQSSLPVDCMDKANQSAWLRRQRSIISCCPNCKKHLPRCFVCLLYIGLVNPQLEYNRVARQKQLASLAANQKLAQNGDVAATSSQTDTATDKEKEKEDRHNVLDFGKWFTWCQHCRHGGHAACLNDWFDDRATCGVNGCDCKCKNIR